MVSSRAVSIRCWFTGRRYSPKLSVSLRAERYLVPEGGYADVIHAAVGRSSVRARLLEAEPILGNRYPSLTCGRSSSPGGHLLRLEHYLVANQWIFSPIGTCCSLPWAFCSFPSLLANRVHALHSLGHPQVHSSCGGQGSRVTWVALQLMLLLVGP